MRIAHFITDEKFPDFAYELFEEVVPGCNEFYLPSVTNEIKYLKKIDAKIIKNDAYNDDCYISSLAEYDLIILHSLTPFNMSLVSCLNGNVPVVWIGMGFDYYDLIYESIDELLSPQTKRVYHDITYQGVFSLKRIKHFIKHSLYKIPSIKQTHIALKMRHKIKAIGKITYFAPVIESEYKLVKEKFNEKFPDYLKWNYGGTGQSLDLSNNNWKLSGSDILLGNSATFTNNHIDAMKLLKEIKLNGKTVVCPLSYGCVEYGRFVAQKGKYYFGDKFTAFLEYMSFDEYVRIISNCSNVIMNHIRQQGVGNINIMILAGAKIFLNEANPLYKYYRECGVKLFTIDQLRNHPVLLDKDLSESTRKSNRQIVERLYSRENSISNTKKLISCVVDKFGR